MLCFQVPPPFGRPAAVNDAPVCSSAEERLFSKFPTCRKAQFRIVALAFFIAGAALAVRPSQAAVSISSFTCASSSFSGAGTDSCTVTMSGPVKGGNGRTVKLSSSSSAVQVPSSVQFPQGTASVSFSANVATVTTATAVTITARSYNGSATFSIQLNPAAPVAPVLSGVSCSQGSLTGAGSDACAVAISKAASSGGFPVALASSSSAVSVPLSVTVPAGATSAAFTATASAVSTTQTATITATANGVSQATSLQLNPATPAAALSAVSCSSGSLTGAGSDACTVSLTAAAPSGGFAVTLASNNSAVKVPASVTLPAGATSAVFTATVAAVSTTQTATITASGGGVSKATSLQLNATSAAWTVASTSVAFGTVALNTTATQSVVITSTGTAALTINSGSVTGTGFSISGLSFPTTLNPGQTTTLNMAFDPTTAASDTGTVTLVSNAASGGTKAIALSGTGQSTSYAVDLTWSAPSSGSDPVAGYNIYRSSNGGSSYQMLNSSMNAPTSYTDSSVTSGASYTYYVESVDGQGNASGPSNSWSVTIP